MSKQASRRKNERKGCFVQASLQIGVRFFQATLSNFCLNGILADCKPESAEALAAEVELADGQVELRCHIDNIKYEITLEVRRASQYYFGLYCPEGLPSLFYEALLQQAQKEDTQVESSATEEGRSASLSRFRLLAQDITYVFDHALVPSMNRYFQRLPEHIMNGAEKALQSNQVQDLFEVSRRLKTQQSTLCRELTAALRTDIVSLFGKETVTAPVNEKRSQGAELSLVETDQFDLWMAIKATAQRIENDVEQHLRVVVNRLKPVLATPEETVLFPQGQTKMLQKVLAKYNVTGRALRIALDYFAQETTPYYEDYLTQLGQLLEQKGYFSRRDIRRTVSPPAKISEPLKAPSTMPLSQNRENRGDENREDENRKDSHLDSARVSLDRANVLLASLRSMHTLVDSTTDVEGAVFLSRQDLLAAIMVLFHSRLQQSGDEHMSEALMSQLEDNAKERCEKISSSDYMAIELVDLFFNEMMHNEHLIHDIRIFLSKIRPLFLYDFLKKSNEKEIRSEFQIVIFSLQEVAHEPLAWTGMSKQNLQAAFDRFLTLVLNDIDDLTEGLAHLKKIIGQSMSHMTNVRNTNKKRVVEAVQARYVIQQKRNIVQTFLKGLLSKQGLVPKWFEQLMRMGWCEHLSFLSIRGLDDDYSTAINQTKMFFDVITNSATNEVAIDDSLQTIVRDIADHFCATLKEFNSSKVIAAQWREQIEDIINQHRNELTHMVPPSHWLLKSSHHEMTNISAYMAHKLSSIEVGSWLYCPHQDKMRRYLKVAWIAPDQSRYLLVNHSFVGAGEMDQEEFVELLSRPGTRTVVETQLPFQTKGIEHHFYSVYDSIRGSLLREKVTGFLDKSGFEQEVQSLIDNEKYIILVLMNVPEEQAITKAYGSEFHSKLLVALAQQLSDSKFDFNEHNQDSVIAHFSRFDGRFAFCLEQKKSVHNQVDLPYLLTRFASMVEQKITQITVFGRQCHLSLQLGCVEVIAQAHAQAVLMILAAETSFEGQKLKGHDHDYIHYASLDQIETEELKQAQIAWVNSLTGEILDEQLKMKVSSISASGDRNYIKFTPEASSDYVIGQLAASNRSILFNQWIIEQSLELFEKEFIEQYTDIIICLYPPASVGSAFFEMLFNGISRVKSTEQVHFCFDSYHMPDMLILQDFSQEVKSYGCQLMLSRWGCTKQSFEVLLGQGFDFVFLDPAIEQRDPEMSRRLISTLEALTKTSGVEVILPASAPGLVHLFSTVHLQERCVFRD